jgi:hypothetical protein
VDFHFGVRRDVRHSVAAEVCSMTVDEQLREDKRLFGNCFWRVVAGQKVRIDPRDVVIDANGYIVKPNLDVFTEARTGRRPRVFDHIGRTVTLRQLEHETGFKYYTLLNRYIRGDRNERLVRPVATKHARR